MIGIIILLFLIAFVNSCIRLSSDISRIEEENDGDNRDMED